MGYSVDIMSDLTDQRLTLPKAQIYSHIYLQQVQHISTRTLSRQETILHVSHYCCIANQHRQLSHPLRLRALPEKALNPLGGSVGSSSPFRGAGGGWGAAPPAFCCCSAFCRSNRRFPVVGKTTLPAVRRDWPSGTATLPPKSKGSMMSSPWILT